MPRKTKMNSITSPELIAQINQENMGLMKEFLDYLRSIQRSDNTIEAYRSDLLIALVWCLKFNGNKFFVNWTKRDVMRYQNWLLTENGNSPARVRRLKASLSSMANFIEAVLDEDYPNFRNIINKIENPVNQPVREKTIYDTAEIEELLSKLIDAKKYKQACAVALAAYSGRRKAELLRFKVSDFDDDRLVCGGALYKSAPIKTKGRGNGKHIPCYTLAKPFKPYLDAWMKYREENGIESEWLFPDKSNPDEHANKGMLNGWTDKFSKMTGKEFYWHSLRHTRVTEFSKSGLPDSVIQSIMGWESAEMCRVYNDMSSDDEIGMWFKDGEINTDARRSLSDI